MPRPSQAVLRRIAGPPSRGPGRRRSTPDVAAHLVCQGKYCLEDRPARQGQSAPVIWGDKIFVTWIEGTMKDTCHVLALASGGWAGALGAEFPASQKVRSNYYQSRATPTPVVDADRVYAFFETGDLVALTHGGQLVWSRSLTKDTALRNPASAWRRPRCRLRPVVLLIDHEGPSYLLAVDKATGKTCGRPHVTAVTATLRRRSCRSARTDQVVCSSPGSVDGYDPMTGKLLWSFDDVGGNNVAAPIPVATGQFLVSGRPGMHNEPEKEAQTIQPAYDRRTRKGRNLCSQGGLACADIAFIREPYVPPRFAYWVNNAGIVTAFDTKSGKQLFAERIQQTSWAAPLGFGDRVSSLARTV